MKANTNDAVIRKGKCLFEKIHSRSNFFFSQLALVTLISNYLFCGKARATSITKEDLQKFQ